MKLVKTQIRRTAGTCICTRSKISQETPDIRSSGHYYLNPRLHTCPLSSASNTPGPDICTATRQPVLHLWVVITPEPNKLHTCIWPICVSLLVAGCFLLMHALQPMVLSPITSMISSRDSSNTSRRRVAKKYINNSFFPCHFLIIRHQAVREASQADRRVRLISLETLQILFLQPCVFIYHPPFIFLQLVPFHLLFLCFASGFPITRLTPFEYFFLFCTSVVRTEALWPHQAATDLFCHGWLPHH